MAKRIKATKNKAGDVETKPVKLSLSVKDRLAFRELFPRQGDILSQVLARDIAEKVQITQAEMKKIELSTEGDKISWNPKAKTVNIVFTNPEITFLQAQVDRLDKEKKITLDILGLCLKIKGN